MFTGLVEARGRVERLTKALGSAVLRISAPFADSLEHGESVSVNGICLTVTKLLPGAFETQAVERTVRMTTLGRWRAGDPVNLERALRAGDRIGGHIVTGHVDGVARIAALTPAAGVRDIVIEVPEKLLPHLVERGSVAVDGVSLTVAAVDGVRVTISLIPETLASTTAGRYRVGQEVNVETDVVAKYRESTRLDAGSDAETKTAGITIERLRELGFTE